MASPHGCCYTVQEDDKTEDADYKHSGMGDHEPMGYEEHHREAQGSLGQPKEAATFSRAPW